MDNVKNILLKIKNKTIINSNIKTIWFYNIKYVLKNIKNDNLFFELYDYPKNINGIKLQLELLLKLKIYNKNTILFI